VDACAGSTTNPTAVFVDSSANVLHVTLVPKAGFADSVVAACLRRVAIHELGHALGLLKHSPSTFDIMNATPTVTVPSVTDRSTVEVLYHTTATVLPPPRP
jgi:predicted Zn-dependent protease